MHRSYVLIALVLVVTAGCPVGEPESGDSDANAERGTLSADVTELFVGGTGSSGTTGGTGTGTTTEILPPVFQVAELFSRTFPGTRGATARQFALADMQRSPQTIDINSDGQPDFAVVNGVETGVVQVFASQGANTDLDFLSLSLDRPVFATIFQPDLTGAADIAVGDIDNDGELDVVTCGDEGVFYLRHPNGSHPDGRALNTTDLRYWNVSHIDGTSDMKLSDPQEGSDYPRANLAPANLNSGFLIDDGDGRSNHGLNELKDMVCGGCNHGPLAAPANFKWTVDNRFERVALGDIDNDGDLDIVTSQDWTYSVELGRDTVSAESNVQMIWLLRNPGNETLGINWDISRLGSDERAARTDDSQLATNDRHSAVGLFLLDLDGDGDLDIISAAKTDNDVQVAWFENPGAALVESDLSWTQWRIGSIRAAISVDVGDVTGDGNHDIVVASTEQGQVFLFEQPSTGPEREYDWDGNAIYSSVDGIGPVDVRIADIDGDGANEIISGETGGKVLYLEPPSGDVLGSWTAQTMEQLIPAGQVGLLGAADFDGDNDLDVVIAVDAGNDNEDRVMMLVNVPQTAGGG